MSRHPAFSAHLGYLFTELPLEDRFAAARSAGFEAVEHPAPFALPAHCLREILSGNGLSLSQVTSGMGNAGEKGVACLPGREDEFRDGYARALDYAEEVGCPFVHAMAGVGGDDATYRRNIDVAARLCEGRPPALLVEAISAAAVPGYHLARIDDLLALAADMPGRVSVLIDTFHAAAGGRDPVEVMQRAGNGLGHVHAADFPGRHQPGTGNVDFVGVLHGLAAMGYRGAIGFEYVPAGDEHLAWLPTWNELRRGAAQSISKGGPE